MPDACEDLAACEPETAEGHDVNTVFFSAEVLSTLHFAEQGAFTLWLGADFTSDQYDWWGEDSDCLVRSEHLQEMSVGGERRFVPIAAEANSCQPLRSAAGTKADGAVRDGRQNLARLRLGGALELALGPTGNIWAVLEGILAGESRDLYGDVLGLGGDTELYFRLGYTHKF